MRIAIDVDGVLIDMGSYLLNKGSKYFWEKYKIGISNPNGYEIRDMFLVNQEKDNDFWLEYMLDYGKEYPARDYASEVIKKLKNEGNEIIIMTARGGDGDNTLPQEQMQDLVKYWLKVNDIIYDELLFTAEDKLNFCKQHKIDVMIEDKPRNVEMISSYIPVLCFNALYNTKVSGKNIYRVYSWYDVYTKLLNLKK